MIQGFTPPPIFFLLYLVMGMKWRREIKDRKKKNPQHSKDQLQVSIGSYMRSHQGVVVFEKNRCGLVEGSVSLGVGFEALKAHAKASVSLMLTLG